MTNDVTDIQVKGQEEKRTIVGDCGDRRLSHFAIELPSKSISSPRHMHVDGVTTTLRLDSLHNNASWRAAIGQSQSWISTEVWPHWGQQGPRQLFIPFARPNALGFLRIIVANT